jgi:hypothetical protein
MPWFRHGSALAVCLVFFAGTTLQCAGQQPFFVPFSHNKASPALLSGLERSEHGRFACVLLPAAVSLSTGDDATAAAVGGPKTAVDKAARLLASLSGNCSSSRPASPGGYSYTVCIGKTVRQSSDGGDFLLGAFNADASAESPGVQQFRDGDQCPGLRRQTSVSFICGETFAILTAEEPSVCNYALTVAHPAVCGMPDVFGGAAAGGGIAASLGVAPGGEGGGAGEVSGRFRWLLRAFPSLRAGRGRVVAQLPEAAGNGKAGPAPAAPASGGGAAPGAEDVAGVGGSSLGVDDHLRRQVRWVGMPGGGGDGSAPGAPVAWALDLSHVAAETVQGEAGLVGTRAEGLAAEDVVCTAYMTDDLRRQSGPARPTQIRGLGGAQVVMLRVRTAAAGSTGASSSLAASAASLLVRGPNRHVQGQISLEGAATSATGGGWVLATAADTADASECVAAAKRLLPLGELGDGQLAHWCTGLKNAACATLSTGSVPDACDVIPVAMAARSGGVVVADTAAVMEGEEYLSLHVRLRFREAK